MPRDLPDKILRGRIEGFRVAEGMPIPCMLFMAAIAAFAPATRPPIAAPAKLSSLMTTSRAGHAAAIHAASVPPEPRAMARGRRTADVSLR